jgi:hypothetical protein
MKKFITNIRTLAALLIASATFVACSSDDDILNDPMGKYTLTVSAQKGEAQPALDEVKGDNTTRGLSLDDKTLNAVWKEGETVEVYNASDEKIAELTPTATGTASTTLTGEITGTMPNVGDALTLKFLSPDYDSQDGTLAYIEAHCDYATAGVTVSSVSGSNITTDVANFVNQQAIVKFTLIDKADGTTKLNPTTFTITWFIDQDHEEEVVKLTAIPAATYEANGDGVLYVALPAISNNLVLLAANVGNDMYTMEKAGVTFANGQYYAITAKTEKYDALNTPLTFLITDIKNTDKFLFDNRASGPVYYTINGGERKEIATNTESEFAVKPGDKVAFYGDNATYGSSTKSSSCGTKNSQGNFYIYGNIMSLVNSENYATATELTSSYTFYKMFSENWFMRNHPYKKIMLPATTLTQYCYAYMFYKCDYLEEAPDLPALTGKKYCYQKMFQNCYSLNSIKCLVKNTQANGRSITEDWVPTGTSSGTIITNKACTNWPKGSSGIPSGWTQIAIDVE